MALLMARNILWSVRRYISTWQKAAPKRPRNRLWITCGWNCRGGLSEWKEKSWLCYKFSGYRRTDQRMFLAISKAIAVQQIGLLPLGQPFQAIVQGWYLLPARFAGWCSAGRGTTAAHRSHSRPLRHAAAEHYGGSGITDQRMFLAISKAIAVQQIGLLPLGQPFQAIVQFPEWKEKSWLCYKFSGNLCAAIRFWGIL